MKLVLLVEGNTEGDTDAELRAFLKRWLDQALQKPVGLVTANMRGNDRYLKDVAEKTEFYLSREDTIAVFGLLDLYQLQLNYPKLANRDEKIKFARQDIVSRVDVNFRPRFHQHFAVHETEAWFLSQPSLFTKFKLPKICDDPENVNFDEPPCDLLDRLFKQAKDKRGYKKRKTTMARTLFPRLNPEIVYEKCRNFRQMMDDMRDTALQALAQQP